MNDNEDTLELLTAFVDGELSPADVQEVQQQMQADPRYVQLVSAQRATKNLLGARLSRVHAPAELKERIRTAIFGGESALTATALPARRSFWQLFAWSPTTASALGGVVLVVVLSAVIMTFNGNRIFPYIKDVHAHHMNAGLFPLQFTGDHEKVASDTSDAVGFAVVVPHLGQGVELEGSRKCTLCGRKIAFIKYNGAEGRVSFFIIPGKHLAIWRLDPQTHDEMVFYTTKHQGVCMAFWHDDDATYCLAAAMPENRLIDLACTACREVQFAKDATSTAVPLVWLAADSRDGGL